MNRDEALAVLSDLIGALVALGVAGFEIHDAVRVAVLRHNAPADPCEAFALAVWQAQRRSAGARTMSRPPGVRWSSVKIAEVEAQPPALREARFRILAVAAENAGLIWSRNGAREGWLYGVTPRGDEVARYRNRFPHEVRPHTAPPVVVFVEGDPDPATPHGSEPRT